MSRQNAVWKQNSVMGVDGFCRSIFGEAAFARSYFGAFDHFSPSIIKDSNEYPGFTVTPVGASTLVMADNVNGWLQLTSSAVENEGIQIQMDGESFLPAAGNDIYFECSVSGNDVTEVDWFIGLCLADTSIVASNPADVIGFWTHDADDNIDFEVSATAGAGAPVDTTVDLAANTAIRLGFHVAGLTKVTPYINGVAYTAQTTVANIPAVEMALAFACLSGEASANRLDIDWYRIIQLT